MKRLSKHWLISIYYHTYIYIYILLYDNIHENTGRKYVCVCVCVCLLRTSIHQKAVDKKSGSSVPQLFSFRKLPATSAAVSGAFPPRNPRRRPVGRLFILPSCSLILFNYPRAARCVLDPNTLLLP